MSNEERIKAWKERRAAGAAYHGASGHVVASESSGSTTGAWLVNPADIGVLLAMGIDALRQSPKTSVAERRSIYRAFETRIENEIDRHGAHGNLSDLIKRQCRAVIGVLETDIRQGVNVFDPGYGSDALASRNRELLRGYQRRENQRLANEARQARRAALRMDVASEVRLSEKERDELRILQEHLGDIRAGQSPLPPSVGARRVMALPHLLSYAIHLIGSESRVALLWAMVGPAVLLSLISSMYFLMGLHFILGMDVPTFSLTGATTWIMVRQIIFRSSTSYVSNRGLIHLDGVTPLSLAIVQVCVYLLIYLVVYGVLITVGQAVGLISLPTHWERFLTLVALMAAGASAIGLIFGSIASRWPYFLRFAAVIERFLEIFSGVFFVSEQLPERLRPYFLWSPFAHGMQLLRSSYFISYQSHDASLPYFLTSIVFLIAVALGCERLARPRVIPM